MVKEDILVEKKGTYIVYWFTGWNIGKRIEFTNAHSAKRHMARMEQDGYTTTMKFIPAA